MIDTVKITQVVHDTVTVINTVHDTVTVTHTVHDTVEVESSLPHVQFAFVAMQYFADEEVLAFINSEFGYSDGWIYYLSVMMSDISNPSTGVYDFYGYIDYWVPDWSGYYPLEYYWRISYKGGDPSDPDNWQLSDPPAAPKRNPGVTRVTDAAAHNLIK